jgi:hypothetical protein
MSLQNRVTPSSDIIATPHRGMFTGNRGIIHDPTTKTLLTRRWANRAWLTCVCEYKGRRRAVMGGRSWTELFFLDEATALSAGHRPCFFCRRDDANRFRAGWERGNGVRDILADDIDTVLHRERLDGRKKRLHPLPLALEELPDGAMVAQGNESYLIAQGQAFCWSPGGYVNFRDAFADPMLLTPPQRYALCSRAIDQCFTQALAAAMRASQRRNRLGHTGEQRQRGQRSAPTRSSRRARFP